MLKAISYILILAGLVAAFLGLRSIWETKQAEQEAEEAWDRTIESQPVTKRPRVRLKKGESMARLSIERLGGEWVVVEGADRADLKKGPGHLINTALPGDKGNCVIAGHRDTQFRMLSKVEIGDDISVEQAGRTYVYQVIDHHVVSPTDTRVLGPTRTPTLTLVTCYPFYYVGPAPKRYIIRAKLVS